METANRQFQKSSIRNSSTSAAGASWLRSRAVLVASLVGASLASISSPAIAAVRSSDMVQFEIKDVGSGKFANAVIAADADKSDTHSGGLCVTLEGGSRNNSAALLTWLTSNSSGAALASKPEAILTVPANRSGLRKGVYRLSKITVDDYIKKADRDLSHPRVDSIKVKCEFLQEPPSSEAAVNDK